MGDLVGMGSMVTDIIKTVKENSTRPNQYYQTACDICGDTGWDATEDIVKMCKCKRRKTITNKLSKIHEEYSDATLRNFRVTKVGILNKKTHKIEKRVFPYDFNPSQNYFLSGGLGLGKTHLMWAQYRELTEKGFFSTYVEIESIFLNKYQEQKYRDANYYDFDRSGVHLFLDEFAKSKYTEDRSVNIFEVINSLYSRRGGLTVTSNKNLRDIEAEHRFGDSTTAITRRIVDMCTVVYF